MTSYASRAERERFTRLLGTANQPDLFEGATAKERRVLVEVLNGALEPKRARRSLLWPMPKITVPGLDPLTGRRLPARKGKRTRSRA
jgi:hypothetical protein